VRKLREYFDDDPEELPFELIGLPVGDRAEMLVEALIHNIQLVTIELEQEDDAQVIFETLNARGEPLTASDLVRNFVFLTATRDGLPVAELYSNLWRDFEEGPPEPPFWRVEERQGRLKRARLDLFLFHYVVFRRQEELTISHLYQGFRKWWESDGPRDVERELITLRKHAAVYRQLLSPAGKTRLAEFARRLRAIDSSTVYPVVLWLADTLGTTSPEFDATIAEIESFLMRRAVCGYNQKNYNRIFLDMLAKLSKRGTPNALAIHEFLAESKADSAVWPSDEAFAQALSYDPLYLTLRPRPTEMLLNALEQASQPKYAEDITIHSALTVEHVWPQNAHDEDWPLAIRSDEDEWEAARRRNNFVHRLGNLTLLTQPLNSAVSNGPYGGEGGKREAITSGGYLALNTYFNKVGEWNESAIEERGQKLAALALKIWPGP
jgi:hypothetical protein